MHEPERAYVAMEEGAFQFPGPTIPRHITTRTTLGTLLTIRYHIGMLHECILCAGNTLLYRLQTFTQYDFFYTRMIIIINA